MVAESGISILFVHPHHGGHQEGDGHGLGAAVDRHLFGTEGLVVDLDLQPPALARQFGKRDGLAVQPVAEMDAHRQRRVGGALIVDILPAGVPDDLSILDGIGQIVVGALDVPEDADILQPVQLVRVVEPFADGDALGPALGVRQDVDRLLFILRERRQNRAADHQRRQTDSNAAHKPFFHDFRPPFIDIIRHRAADAQ